jgi:hypothetical protein
MAARLRECSIELAANTNNYVDYDKLVKPVSALGKALLRGLYDRLPIKLASLDDERVREEVRQYYGFKSDADDHTAEEIWQVAQEVGAVWYQKQQTGKPGLADVELRDKFEDGPIVRKELKSLMKSAARSRFLKVCSKDFSFLFEYACWAFQKMFDSDEGRSCVYIVFHSENHLFCNVFLYYFNQIFFVRPKCGF